MADMLSRARFDDEGGMVSEDEEVSVAFFEAAYLTTKKGSTSTLNEFDKSKYDGEWLQIGGFLKTRQETNWIRKKLY
jgi:lipocalin